jgi:endonuclease/exonuclease/phosphatase family metal-dependent hydrolase
MKSLIVGACACLFLCTSQARSADEVRIATFNIQNFGPKKASTDSTLKYLAEVVRQFDIVAVQEISDVKNRVPDIFLEEINRSDRRYAMLVSERSGRQPNDRTSQEQYAFYYDTSRIEALGQGTLYDDSQMDLFQREPFTARFGVAATSLTFTVTQIHTRPESAVDEIDALFEVYEDVEARHKPEVNHIVLGDFNAGCSYAKPAQLAQMKIRSAAFYWVVPDDADTTVSPNTSCAYDRIVITKALQERFSQWGIANWFTDNKISDHWPVWASFQVAP